MTAEKRYLFVLGTGRCGSSLVQELIARHPDVGFLSNVDDRLSVLDLKGQWNSAIYQRIPPRLARKGRLRFAPSEGYRALRRRVSPIICEPPRDLLAGDASPWLTTRLRDFFDSRHAAQTKPVFVHKFTGWPRAGLLREVFPTARFVHIYRDGRAVANSLAQMPWWSGHRGPDQWRWGELADDDRDAWQKSDRSWPVLAAIEWKMLMDALGEAEARVPEGQWLSVKYEDLITDPNHWLAQILEFAGLSDNETFWSHVRSNTLKVDRIDAYRQDLRPEEVQVVEQVLKDHLEVLGYRVGGS